MSRRGSGFTGANAIPLGPRNPAIGSKRTFSATPPSEKQPSLLKPQMPPPQQHSQPSPQQSSNAAAALRAAQAAAASLQQKKFSSAPAPPLMQAPPPQPSMPTTPQQTSDERGRPRKKRSRWSTPEVKTDIPGIPSTMPANLSKEQQQAYIVQLQIEDVTRKLKSGDLGISPNPEDRSPSPEPIYNNEGKRLNTREYRTRKRLEEERHKLIQDMIKINENYKPPVDYKPPVQRISEQINIPSDLNPSINFVGLLIGPRGNTLKKIEKECNCKIMIRGKGSVKEGKIGRKDGLPLPGEDEPLHALITGTTIESVQKASKEIHKIIKQGIEQPEGQNDLRKLQLMELARLNGTLRDDALPREREWLKPENQNVTNTTVCTKCGGRGHLSQDCMAMAPSMGLQQNPQAPMNQVDKAKMDSEYLSLMAELGEGPPPSDNSNSGGGNKSSGGGGGFGGQRPPWGGGGGQNKNDDKPPPLMGTNFGPYPGPPSQSLMGTPPPWMRGGPRGGRGGNFRGRGFRGGRGGYGGRGGGGPNNYGGGGNNFGGDGYGNAGGGYGGFNSNNDMEGGGNMGWGGNQYDNSNMGGYGPSGMDNSGSGGNMGGFNNPPPPPPPSNAPQPPPPPSSDSGSWQQNQWGQNDDKDNKKGSKSDKKDSSGNQNSGNNMMGGGGNNMMGGANNMMGGANMMGRRNDGRLWQ
uniref:splicing factor 1-like n=1 Tax=Styela clava TaxID=7725 RepID=UPI001939B4AA|nr:splicing factor 1-like [Styela clava]